MSKTSAYVASNLARQVSGAGNNGPNAVPSGCCSLRQPANLPAGSGFGGPGGCGPPPLSSEGSGGQSGGHGQPGFWSTLLGPAALGLAMLYVLQSAETPPSTSSLLFNTNGWGEGINPLTIAISWVLLSPIKAAQHLGSALCSVRALAVLVAGGGVDIPIELFENSSGLSSAQEAPAPIGKLGGKTASGPSNRSVRPRKLVYGQVNLQNDERRMLAEKQYRLRESILI